MITGKTKIKSNNIFGGLFSGDFFKKKSIISEEDIQSLENYNRLLADNTPAEAFKQSMNGASKTAQNLAKSAKGAAVDIGAIPKASKAATVGIKLLSVAMNIGATLAITALISGITKMIGASEEMSQQASEATSNYKEQTASIDEYKNKITELKTALNDENISYSDARDKRSQLLDIQKQLIDTYGAEASGINLVNGSLDDQIEKLDTLNKQKRQEWENEVNKQTTGQWWQKWGGYLGLALLDTVTLDWSFYDANKWLEDFDNTTNIERITKKVENFKKSINLNDLDLDSEELEKLKSQLDSFNGVSFKGNKMTIAGDAKTVQDTITQIQTQVIGSREDLRSLDQDLKDVYNSAKKIVDANWDTYNTALQNQILDDKTGLEYYGKLTEAYETYQEAVKDGDENTINEAKEGYAKILSDITGSDMSDSFKKFFENMYPDISDIVDDWKFEVEIVPKINKNTDGLKDDIETVKELTTEEISAAFENNGTGVTKDQWKAITDLNTEAQANGLDLTTFLEQLREAEYLVSQLDKDIEKAVNDTKNKYGDGVDWGKYFKDNSIDTQEEIDKWNEVTKGIDNAEDAMNAYAEATKNANKMTVSLSEMKGVAENISTLQKAFKELSDNGYITVATLAEVQVAASLSEDEWKKYETALLNAKVGSDKFNQVMTELTYTMLENKFGSIDLTNATEDEISALETKIATMLRGAGVTNADTVAHDYLTASLIRTQIQSNILNGTFTANIATLQITAAQAGITGGAFTDLVAKIAIANSAQLGMDNVIKTLQTVGYYASWSAEQINRIGQVKTVSVLGKDVMATYDKDGKLMSANILSVPEMPEITVPSYSGGGSGGGGSGGSSSDKNEALDNYLKYAEDLYKVHQDEVKYINDIQWAYDNLAKTMEEQAEIAEKIEQACRDYAENRIKDLEHENELLENAGQGNSDAYLNNLKEMQSVYSGEANRYREWMHKQLVNMGYTDENEISKLIENSDFIQEMQKGWWDKQKAIVEVDYSNSSDWIDERNKRDDWGKFGDNEVAAWQRVLDRYLKEYPDEVEKIKEIEENLFEARKNQFEESIEDIDTFIDKRNAYNDWDNWGTTELKELAKQKTILRDMLNQELISLEVFNERIAETNQRMYETMKEQTVDVLNHRSSQMSSLKTLLQSHYDVSNAVSDAQYEINKELAASKTMYQHLNEETRKLLFNQEDYNTLSEKLVDIQSEANKLQDQYSRDILGATENELDKITSQYEMQYETLMKTYEIAKAELEVAKKRQQLDNVLKERNVRMFIDGQWQWVANTQDVINAQNELADAEHTRRQNEASLQQTQSLNELQKAQDILTTTISNVEDGIVDFAKYTETMNIELDGIVTESIPGLNDAILLSQSAIRTFAKSLSLSGKGSTTSSFHNGVFYESGVDYKSEMTKSDTTLSEALALNTQRDAKIDGDGRSEGKMTNADVIKLWKESHGYACGTDNTSNGWITLGELEKEWLIKSNGQFVPIQEPTLANVGSGGIVFNQNQMDNVRKLWNLSNLDNFGFNNPSIKSGVQSVDNSNSNNVIIENVTIEGNSFGGKTILTTLRRVAANH